MGNACFFPRFSIVWVNAASNEKNVKYLHPRFPHGMVSLFHQIITKTIDILWLTRNFILC